MAKRRPLVPLIIPVLPSDESKILGWLRNFVNNLSQFSRSLIDTVADYDLIGNVTVQTLASGFTIDPDSYFIEITAASAVTSDATTCIKNGRTGQAIILHNIGSNDITLKDAANTQLGGDVTLAQHSTLFLRWSENMSYWVVIH